MFLLFLRLKGWFFSHSLLESIKQTLFYEASDFNLRINQLLFLVSVLKVRLLLIHPIGNFINFIVEIEFWNLYLDPTSLWCWFCLFSLGSGGSSGCFWVRLAGPASSWTHLNPLFIHCLKQFVRILELCERGWLVFYNIVPTYVK